MADTEAPVGTSLGSVVAKMRVGRRLSQSGLAEMAGLSHSHISRIESGDRTPSKAAVEAIADGLDLGLSRRAELFHVAGYYEQHLEIDDPDLMAIQTLIIDRDVPENAKESARVLIRGVLMTLRSAKEGWR
jgi:transcriptional regulator with XRE-family HTH domain